MSPWEGACCPQNCPQAPGAPFLPDPCTCTCSAACNSLPPSIHTLKAAFPRSSPFFLCRVAFRMGGQSWGFLAGWGEGDVLGSKAKDGADPKRPHIV